MVGKGALLALLPLMACTEGGRWTGTIVDRTGMAIVENTDEGMWTAAQRRTFEEEIRIGAVEGDLDYQFGQIGSLAVGSNGRIYVSDTQGQHIKVFSRDGRHEQTIAGPGELGRNAAFVALTVGDTVIVPDPVNRRINRYAPDGTSLAAARRTGASGAVQPERGQLSMAIEYMELESANFRHSRHRRSS